MNKERFHLLDVEFILRIFFPYPVANDELIQPILAYGDGSPEYTIFNGYYDWHDGNWVQSADIQVNPGDIIDASVTFVQKDNSYTQSIAKRGGGAPILSPTPVLNNELYVNVYFVVEHQPNSCGEYPADGIWTVQNITVAYDNAVLKDPKWTCKQFQPACSSQGKVIDANTLEFTWTTN